MPDRVAITSATYSEYKALSDYSLRLSHMNILVGPNNCGKSTILGAFRVLTQALRSARSRRAEMLSGPEGRRPGWRLNDELLPISSENIHTNYADTDTKVVFRTSNSGQLTLLFPEQGGCYFFADGVDGPIRAPGELKRNLPIDLVVVPVLGPLEHQEILVTEQTTRKNMITTRASRNFRNYWYRYPDGFDDFATLVSRTWPGIEVLEPELLDEIVGMFCLEDRITRELYWAGFGFQIWLQLLTHISRSPGASLIVVDEPELYLHPDVQRQLLGILREVGPDVLLATHSTEIMSEADPSEIVLIDKTKRSAQRLKDAEGVQKALDAIGSIQNITLTRLARNKRLLFTEGEFDFRLVRRFARRLGFTKLAAGTDLTSLESGGFSAWERIRALAAGFEHSLGFELHVGAIFDRDYWCDEEIEKIERELIQHLEFSHIHQRKEIENYLLIPSALERALGNAMQERFRRTNDIRDISQTIEELLEKITAPMRSDIQSQYIAKRVDFMRQTSQDTSTIARRAVDIFDNHWRNLEDRMCIVPGKSVLASLRAEISQLYAVSLTDHRIVSAFNNDDIPSDLSDFIEALDNYRLGVTR